jgi:hypothetical protein
MYTGRLIHRVVFILQHNDKYFFVILLVILCPFYLVHEVVSFNNILLYLSKEKSTPVD